MIEQRHRWHRPRRGRRHYRYPQDRNLDRPQRMPGLEPREGQKASGGEDSLKHKFHEFARRSSQALGHPWSFVTAILLIVAWAITGPIFHFSDTWQLVINTATTIITFLMVFLIQNTQNRDAKAIHLKLDELLRGVRGARNRMIDLEELSDEELEALQREFERLRRRAPPESCEEKQPSQT